MKNFRQQDEIFHTILAELRKGKITKQSYTILKQRVGLSYPPNITQLVSTRLSAEHINHHHYSSLTGEDHIYKLEQHTTLEMTEAEQKIRRNFTLSQIEYELRQLQKNIQCDFISLKKGAFL